MPVVDGRELPNCSVCLFLEDDVNIIQKLRVSYRKVERSEKSDFEHIPASDSRGFSHAFA